MAEDLKRALGLTIQAARRRVGLTQEELAGQIGRTPESISNIERGRQLPALDTLLDLARTLGVPAIELIGGGEGHAVSRERARAEARLRELARSLTDRDLRLTLALMQAMNGPGE